MARRSSRLAMCAGIVVAVVWMGGRGALMGAHAMFGLAGLILLTVAATVAGYRQAKAAQSVRIVRLP